MLEIGEHVIYNGRAYVLVGITPMSVTPFEMQLQDPQTGARFWIKGEARQHEGGLYEVLREAASDAAAEARDKKE